MEHVAATTGTGWLEEVGVTVGRSPFGRSGKRGGKKETLIVKSTLTNKLM